MKKNATSLLIFIFLLSLASRLKSQENGLIYLSTDQGVSWRQADLGFPKDATVNDFLAYRSQIFAATENKGVYVSSDRGQNWRPAGLGMASTEKVDALAVYHNILFAGTYQNGIYTSIDGGQSWFPSSEGLTNLTIRALDARNDIIYAGTNDGVFASKDQGKSWRSLTAVMQINAFAFADQKIYAATNKGIILSKDQGQNWDWIYEGSAVGHIALHGDQLFAINYGDEIWQTTNDGQSWTRADAGLRKDGLLCSFAMASFGRHLLVGRGDGVFLSYTNGLNWERVREGVPAHTPIKELEIIDGVTLIAGVGQRPKEETLSKREP